MTATQCLRDEHQLILRVLECFEPALTDASRTGHVSQEVFGPFLEFFRGFADRCHHCKEEDRLFPSLVRKGLPRESGPIAVMLDEHEQGRMHVRTMIEHLPAADSGDDKAAQAVLDHGTAFLGLLRSHIGKEDHVLFAMADGLIQGPDLDELRQAYQDAEQEPVYCQTVERCRAIAEDLVKARGAREG